MPPARILIMALFAFVLALGTYVSLAFVRLVNLMYNASINCRTVTRSDVGPKELVFVSAVRHERKFTGKTIAPRDPM